MERKIPLTFIIDDDKIFVFILKKVIEKNKNFDRIKEFRNGEEVLEILSKQIDIPNIILLDINMPVIDGWQFLDEVEQLQNKDKLNIFIMSSSIDQRDIAKSKFYSTVKDFISKPITSEKLDSLIEKIV